MSKKIARYLSVVLAVSVLFSGFSLQVITAYADTAGEASVGSKTVASSASELFDYVEYTADHAVTDKAEADVNIPIGAYVANGADVAVENNSLIWTSGEGSVTWSFEATQTALYNLEFVWEPRQSGINPEFSILIDGKCPFKEAENIVLSRLWKNAKEEPRKDAQGNEYAQEQVEIGGKISSLARDSEGATIGPLEFALTAGSHTLTVVSPQQDIIFYSLAFIKPEEIKSYAKVASSYDIKSLDADVIKIEGEAADVKSSNSIIPKSNNSNAGMTPSHKYLTKINYIGGTSWKHSGSTITWNFNVEKSGYYYLNMRYKQSDLVNGESWRWLKIDGKTPFEEAKSLKFPYDTSWKYYNFADEKNEPYYFYLEEGPHTVSLEVTVGDMSKYFYELSKIVDVLGDEYIKIVMITSEDPDVSRDYDLDKQIPGFLDTLTDCSNKLGKLSEEMTGDNDQASQAVSAMKNMKRVIDNMIKSPYIAQQYVKDYYTNYTSIGSWLYDMISMPLAVDQIQFVPAGKNYVNNNANFFEQLAYDTVRLVSSFSNDYSLTDADAESENTIRLWVNWGQDQAAALNSLIEDSFTPKTGISVKVEIVNASLINGILAGNYPDMSLQMARTEPVNLGIRGALADLKQFDDYDQVLERFQDGAEVPYTYNGAAYALPDTQNFMLMFYRNDVLDELGLEVPKTWDEFLHCATIIQRNNMNVYVPFTQITTSTVVNQGIGNLHLYPTLMWQNGLSIYNEERNATAIASKSAIDVFKMWTDFYLKYDFYKEADFYNRLRVGVMPLGIAPYTTYMQFYSAAPEIRGRWSIATVPGTVAEDGSINRSVAGSGTGCAIIKKSDKQKQAWEFLKWWTSADTQKRYNNNLQSLLGMIGRTAVSNVEAFNSLAWDKDDLAILNEQWKQVNEVSEVPGSYDVTRAIDQAFWAVLEDDAKVKDSVTKWSKVADREIERKISEYF